MRGRSPCVHTHRLAPVAALCILGCLAGLGEAELVAFPEAEGHGRFASGGRGGDVYEVTNLNDSGPGSLRAAVDASGPRTVVFRVSGIIYLDSTLRVSNRDLTVAGQTAPGDGICLANYTLHIDANNVIVRFLRVRVGDLGPGNADGRDAIYVRYTDRVIVDHCSFSWSIDECASAYDNTHFTMQWCLVSESLNNSIHSKGAHGYGGIWGGEGATFHHNLLAHHNSRTPRFNGSRGMPKEQNGVALTLEQVDHRNNVIYNWGGNSCYGGEPRDDGTSSLYNMIGNYYKDGPATADSKDDRIVDPTQVDDVYSRYCITGNLTTASAATTTDNWLGVDGPSAAEKEAMRLDEPVPADPLTQQDASGTYDAIMLFVGTCFPARDSYDTRVLAEVAAGTAPYGNNGIIDSQSQVGGWPALASFPAPADGDHDGMPTDWEIAHGLNPWNPADRNGDLNGNGYTNLEDYLNGLVHHLYPQPELRIVGRVGGPLVSWENQRNDAQLEVSTDFAMWGEVAGASGSAGEVTDGVTTPGEARVFRLVGAGE